MNSASQAVALREPMVASPRRNRFCASVALAAMVVALSSLCGCRPGGAPAPEGAKAYAVKGVVYEVKSDGRTAIVRHEEVPGYMPPMVMPLQVKDPAELAGLARGDEIAFRLWVTADEDWIDQVRKTGKRVDLPADAGRIEPPADFDSLAAGDTLPDCVLTNEFGGRFRISDFRGRALALTFFFTRCPLPTYCPLMSRNFAEAYRLLEADADASAEWHLLSISFDPEHDTPEVLREYARGYRGDASRWHFGTGDLEEIQRVSGPLGLMMVRENDTISHNLRTVVLDAQGRIAKLFMDNAWQPSELVEAIRAAARSAAAEAVAKSGASERATALIEIGGMSCEACAKTIRSHLLKSPGVEAVRLVWTDPLARIEYDPTLTSPETLIAVVRDLEYGARLGSPVSDD